MKKRIGILHAHYSNIAYIEQALAGCDVELMHFVDPGLVYRVASDESFSDEMAREKATRQVEWIAGCQIDIILITCTNYIALLQDDQLDVSVPVVKIDEPFFTNVCAMEEPQILLFTNPATVEGTMKRLSQFALRSGKTPQVEVRIIEHAFGLVMQGKKTQAHAVMTDYMKKLLDPRNGEMRPVSVAQLSMVDAARDVAAEYGVAIGDPLAPLADELIKILRQ